MIAKYCIYFCHMMERAEMGCFKMSPSKLRLYHLHNSPGFACTFSVPSVTSIQDSSDSLRAVTDYVGQVWNFFGNIYTKS